MLLRLNQCESLGGSKVRTYIWLSFAFMGWAYFELSGGADFVAESRPLDAVSLAQSDASPDQSAPEPVVTAATAPATAALVATPASLARETPAASPAPTAPEPEQTPATLTFESLAQVPERVSTPAEADLRAVAGARVNMRAGPGTSYGVIDTLSQGTPVEVLEVQANGWARLVVSDTGTEGWMAARLLTDPA